MIDLYLMLIVLLFCMVCLVLTMVSHYREVQLIREIDRTNKESELLQHEAMQLIRRNRYLEQSLGTDNQVEMEVRL
jgi:cell division protein FtsL